MPDVPATTPPPPAALPGMATKRGVYLDDHDLGVRLPQLQIVHKVDSAEAIARGELPGGFKLGDRLFPPALSVVFLLARRVRQWQVKQNGGKPESRCASADGITPLDDLAEPPSPLCKPCPQNQWRPGTRLGPDGKLKNLPPACGRGVALLGVIPEANYLPFWFVCFRTAEPAARKFVRAFREDPTVGGLEQWQVRLTTELTRDEKGGLVWYLPIFTVEHVLPADQYAAMAAAAASLTFRPFVGAASRAAEGPTDSAQDPPPNDAPLPDDDDIPF